MITEKNNEIEIKLPLYDISKLKTQLKKMGFIQIVKREHEYNIVFDTPDMGLKKKQELLRLRKKGESSWITYKQSAPPNPHGNIYKIRKEIEISVSEFSKTKAILVGLGFQIYFLYEKYRETYQKDDTLIMIDQTPIGDYIEIEGSPIDIDHTSNQLGYSKSQYIIESYLSLFRKKNKKGHMLFK